MGRALVEDRKLRLDEVVEHRVALFDHFSKAEADRNMIPVVLQVKYPYRRAAQVVAVTQLEEIKWL